jgi:hypothetical protein
MNNERGTKKAHIKNKEITTRQSAENKKIKKNK